MINLNFVDHILQVSNVVTAKTKLISRRPILLCYYGTVCVNYAAKVQLISFLSMTAEQKIINIQPEYSSYNESMTNKFS